MNELFLYEHGQSVVYPGDLSELETVLERIWQQRSREDLPDFWREAQTSGQRFLEMGRNNTLRARNYVGFIRGAEFTIHILPKLYDGCWPDSPSPEELDQVYRQVLWWLSYTPYLQVPQHLSGSDQTQADPMEILIGLFATLTRQVLSQSLFQAYENRSDELAVVRGRLEMSDYLRHCLSTARWHRVRCSYESFELDNLLNRLIKRVSRLLLPWTQRALNRQKLEDILYFLDEVSDLPMQAQDCERVKLNPMFEDYRPILDYCRLFLQNSVSYAYKPDLQVFALLIPMERLFEQFLAGFLKTHQSQIKGLSRVEFQKSDLYLAQEHFADGSQKPVFQMRHDLLIEYQGREIIIDAKYKRLNPSKAYNGVSQADLYQMVAYAVKRGVKYCELIYPQIPGEVKTLSNVYHVPLASGENPIQIRVNQIPFVNKTLNQGFSNPDEILLMTTLEEILEHCLSTQSLKGT
jgi:5-methylcytosine-specific restriction enzyme subunit McrC